MPQKITITTEAGDEIEALFNPERYTVTKGVQFAEIGIPGLDSPVLQFVRGQNEKIQMELFFDTTDQGMIDPVQDVRELSGQVYQLLKVDGETHAPPRVQLSWGDDPQLTSYGSSVNPWLVLENISEEFGLFSPNGIPLRAKLNCTFREAWTIEQQLQATPRHSSDRTSVRQVQRGQTLAYIAFLEYGDPTQWRVIADANQIENPRVLKAGTTLTIPRNISGTTTSGGAQ